MDNLEDVLMALYISEINAQIRWCWDGGFDVAIGNAFCCGMNEKPEAEATFATIGEVKDWLAETATKLYPDSLFAKECSQKTT